MSGRSFLVLVAAAVLVLAWAVTRSHSPASPPAVDASWDAGAQLSCEHFSDVARDYSNGLLTDSELRAKLQEVWNDAQVSEEPGISAGAERMLSDVTQGGVGDPDLAAAVTAFSDACRAAES